MPNQTKKVDFKMFAGVIKNVIFLMTLQVVLSQTISPTSNKCQLPQPGQLEDLVFKLHPYNTTLEMGSSVEVFDVVHVACINGKSLRGPPSLICGSGGKWSNDFPTCSDYCDGTLLGKLSSRAFCDYKGSLGRCPHKIAPDTLIQLKCAYGYRHNSNSTQNLRCLSNGSFDKTPQHCEADCGQIAPESALLSKQGTEIPTSKAPWHVAIYEQNVAQYNYRCGGTIVSPTVVISAADCFLDSANQKLDNSTRFHVLAGRGARNLSAEQTQYAQAIEVQEVHIPEEYFGQGGQQKEDMALLILALPLGYSETVSPICFPKDLRSSASTYLERNAYGFVSIYDENNQLERIQVKTTATQAAKKGDDKCCAYASDGGVKWTANSGAGFYFEKRDLATGTVKYNFFGVLSRLAHSDHAGTRTVDQTKIALTSFFNVSSTFQRKVLTAIQEDKLLA